MASTASTSVLASSASTIDDSGTVRFTNVQDLFKTIDSTTRDSLTVTYVSLNHFTEIESTREKQRRKFRFRYYDSNSQILIIAIPTGLHEQLHIWLYMEYFGQVDDMGLKRSWISIASTTFSARQGNSGRISKEGDSTGRPMPERAAKGTWPTLIIEAGVSETLGQLRLDMRRWFSISNHDVKIVLLAKFDGTKILLEKWEEDIQARPGATTTRRSVQQQEPILKQSIIISQNTTTHPVSYDVTSGALILSFRLLFLRDPCDGEGDFVISVQELKEYAEIIWAQV
ncbi:hypothetical protein QBC43DRAFT_327516 [Cladorrhinum sp. PSN259]|nr:hypothetical protein QBC43DRAFT_327516 [Cladorrhinum sp. PSN259]